MKKWEYLECVDLEDINDLGLEGWELISSIRYTVKDRDGYDESHYYYLFKRELP